MQVIQALEEEMSVGLSALMMLANVTFVTLHGPGGQEITLNVGEVSSIRQRREGSEGHFPDDVRCIVTMTNGNVNAVVESCLEVVHKISDATKEEN